MPNNIERNPRIVALERAHLTAFGEHLVAALSPQVQLQFAYGVNSRLVKSLTNGSGSQVTGSNGFAVVTAGAAAGASARMMSRTPVQYTTGEGVRVRFTAIFTTPKAGSRQIIGIGNQEDGFFFGYDGTTFGTLRRSGGKREIRTLTVSAAATGNGNAVITLDGNATNVAVVSGDNVVDVARKIAATSFAANGTGWEAYAAGATVMFVSYDAAAHSGTYSVGANGTGVDGTFAQNVAGAAPTDTWNPQTSWDGPDNMTLTTGSYGQQLDQTKLNVYQITYQWLGGGEIDFFIEARPSGGYELVDRLEYTNLNTSVSIRNPTLPLCVEVVNTTNNTALSLSTPSLAGFTEGEWHPSGVDTGIVGTEAGNATTETPVLTVRNRISFGSISNRAQARLDSLFMGATTASGATRTSTFKVYLSPALVGGSTSFTDYDTSNSILSYDVAATGVSGGTLLYSIPVQAGQTVSIPFDSNDKYRLQPGDTLCVTSTTASGGTNDVTVSANFFEMI